MAAGLEEQLRRGCLLFGMPILLVSLALAQPEAPIEWGQIRLLQQAPDTLQCRDIYAHGDTLALLGFRPAEDGSGYLYPAAAVTGNNGEVWSPWHVFQRQSGDVGYSAGAIGGNAISVIAGVPEGTGRGFYRTTDLGASWILPSVSLVGLRTPAQLGDTVFCVVHTDSVSWTGDNGITFAPLRRSYARQYNSGHGGILDIALSSSRIHTFGIGNVQGDFHWRVLYSVAPLLDGEFSSVQTINSNIYGTYATDAEFDRDGTGVLASIVMYHLPLPYWGDLVVNTTRDDGQTWSPPDTITHTVSADPFYVYVRHWGPLWAVVWWDSTYMPPYSHGGGWVRFSANWGRSWYPIQQAYDGHETFGGDFCEADLTPSYIRLYEAMSYWNNVPGWYYFQWEGAIEHDTLAPVISEAQSAPANVPIDTTLFFGMSAWDNDSLWQAQLVLTSVGSSDSLILNLIRTDTNTYSITWTVPSDTAEWHYYYRAEDMWERVATYPDSGWLSFATVPNAATDPFILSPSSFLLSVFPNPSNGWPRLELSADWFARGAVEVEVWDVLGRRVWEQSLEERRAVINYGTTSSGVFFLVAKAGEVRRVAKVMLLR